MHAQLLALQKLVQLLDPPLHAHLERHECLDFFFTYRWLLILFKREFTFDEVRPAARLIAACWFCSRSRHIVAVAAGLKGLLGCGGMASGCFTAGVVLDRAAVIQCSTPIPQPARQDC